MARLVTVILILTVVACVCAAPARKKFTGVATASHGSIAVGQVSGGKFDSGSFSIGHGGNSVSGDGGHGGNHGGNYYGGGGDGGHISYA